MVAVWIRLGAAVQRLIEALRQQELVRSDETLAVSLADAGQRHYELILLAQTIE